ncbi:hypothetical protein V1264_016674 [Littorina saxatilis]
MRELGATVQDVIRQTWVILQVARMAIGRYLMVIFPSMAKKRQETVARVLEDTPFKESDFEQSFMSWTFLKRYYMACTITSYCVTKLHDLAPDCDLVTLTGGKQRMLCNMKAGRPLVLNFGSCT